MRDWNYITQKDRAFPVFHTGNTGTSNQNTFREIFEKIFRERLIQILDL